MTAKTTRETSPGSSEANAQQVTSSLALGLEEILRLLPPRELQAIASGLKIRIDPAKRIDEAAQVARALLCMPEARDPSRLPAAARELLFRIVEARGVLRVRALPAAVGPLVARGLVFARAAGKQAELLLPIAYMVQLVGWEGEDPRAIRRLITQTSPSVQASIASYYLGAPATNPVALALETAWRALSDVEFLKREVAGLVPAERKLLLRIEELGGEVDTEELLDLEREPLRMRGAAGATPSRRGVGFALEHRGFLIPIHPNRHVIPSELVEIIGTRRREAAAGRRNEIRSQIQSEDNCPRRAIFACPPSNLAMALSMYVRERSVEVKPGLGTPRSLLTRLANRFGQSSQRVAFLGALCRAMGLWESSARNAHAPPGNLTLDALNTRFFEVWRQGGAWDEARSDAEVLRAAGAAREQSVVGTVRAIVLESLLELGEGRWVSWEAISGYVLTDGRAPGLERLLERWAARCGVPANCAKLEVVAQRIAFESLHFLGCVDVAEPGEASVLRITALGRACLLGLTLKATKHSAFQDVQTLRLEGQVTVAQVLSLVPFVQLGEVDRRLEVDVSTASVSSALAEGLEASVVGKRLLAVAPVPAGVASLLEEASTVVGRAQFIPSGGFLWVDDAEVRELLRTRRATTELFVDPSPPGGLLLAAGVQFDKVVRRCRTLGVTVSETAVGAIVTEGSVVRVPVAAAAVSAADSETRTRSGTRKKVSASSSRARGAASSARKPRTG